MSDSDRLAERLAAVERALTDGDHELADLGDAAAVRSRLDDLERRTEDAETRLAELEAAVRALRGYVGNVDAVNEAVERRADAALAAAKGPGASEPDPNTAVQRDDDADPTGSDWWRDAGAPAAGDPPSGDTEHADPDSAERSTAAGGSSPDRPPAWLDRHDATGEYRTFGGTSGGTPPDDGAVSAQDSSSGSDGARRGTAADEESGERDGTSLVDELREVL